MIARVLVVCVLAGCPTGHGFNGQIVAATGPVEQVGFIVTERGAVADDELVAVPGAQVTCGGCAKPIAVDKDGRFFVGLRGAAMPFVVHVTAPSYQPIDFEITRPPQESQAGYASFVIVMRPATPAPPAAAR